MVLLQASSSPLSIIIFLGLAAAGVAGAARLVSATERDQATMGLALLVIGIGALFFLDGRTLLGGVQDTDLYSFGALGLVTVAGYWGMLATRLPTRRATSLGIAAAATVGLWQLSSVTEVLFVHLAAVVLASGYEMLNVEELIHAVVYLGLVLGGVAGLYLTLSAEFLAAIQVLIYVGAVITLILFAVMLTTPASPTEGFAEDRTPLSVLGVRAPQGMDVESMADVPDEATTVREAEEASRAPTEPETEPGPEPVGDGEDGTSGAAGDASDEPQAEGGDEAPTEPGDGEDDDAPGDAHDDEDRTAGSNGGGA